MKKTLVLAAGFWALLGGWVLLASGCAQPGKSPAPLVLGQGSDNTRAVLAPGQELRIQLEENPTTGYGWHVVAQDTGLLELAGKKFMPPDTDRVGAPGTALFVFKALRTGETTLELGYYRSWEGVEQAAARFRLAVRIQ